MVFSAVFNEESHQEYAYPQENENPFNAYDVDATAGAVVGETSYNEITEDFTHSIFTEVATSIACTYCPLTDENLHAIYNSGDYPFYFVSMVDLGNKINDRLRNDYNIYGYPTAFFDGGYQVMCGGVSNEQPYRDKIVACGQRIVPDLDLSLSVTSDENNNITAAITITNNEKSTYSGTLRIYFTEIISHYIMSNGEPFSFSCIDFFTFPLSINTQETYEKTITFNPDIKSIIINDINVVERGMIESSITNAGDFTLYNIKWYLTIYICFLKWYKLYDYRDNTIDEIAPGETVTIQLENARPMIGLRRIIVQVQADTEMKSLYGIMLGKFIFIP